MASTDRPQLNKGQYIEDKCEQLFLLEVLVDKIKIKTEGLLGSIEAKEEPAVVEEEEEQEEEELTDEEEAERRREEARKRKRKKPITRPIKVKVKFFDFPTIEIDEWDFTEAKEERQRKLDMLKEEEDEETQEEKADDLGLTLEEYQERMKRKKQQIAEELENTMPPGDKFCSGKSCLFPIIPLDLVNAIKKSPLYVQVQRAGDASQGPRVIGRTNIQLGDNFVEAIALASTPTILPVSAFIDGPYNLKNVFGEVTAVVDLYVRISCFGNSIFTQFKLKEGEEDYLFKMSGSNLSDLERINQMNKSKEYGPILNPIFTQSEDFSVGIKAPVLYPIDPNLKPPVSWRKPYDYPKQIPVCPPKKLYRKPRPKVKYRKKIYKDLDLLQEVIPGFGRQLGDPNFVADNPTLPRYSEEINEHDGAKTKEDQFKNAENPGITLPCQFGARWSPLKFPLLTVPRYPPLKDLWRMDLPNVRNLLLPTFREASKIAKIRMSLLEDIFTEDKALKCTCNTLQRGITPLPFSCSCDESLPAYKCEKEFPPSEHTSMIRNKEYAKIPPDPNLNEKIKECVKKKFPIFDNIGYYDQDPLVMTATIEYDTSDSDQYTTITNDGDSPSTFDINMRLIETFNTKKYPFSLRDSGKKNSLDETSGAERTEWIVRRHRMNASNGRTATVYSRAPNVKVGSLSDDNCKCVNKTKKVQETPVQPRNRFDDFSEDEVDEVLLRKKNSKRCKIIRKISKRKRILKFNGRRKRKKEKSLC
ncbi:hypothetical protein O3M35_000378 [Rhynocoris fuscipes]|uniref:Uncharacterized protein n=1 Tax=Rhynocoris fuscipes TaxID=488301 RepID=A0AAW1DRP7_9HEMI